MLHSVTLHSKIVPYHYSMIFKHGVTIVWDKVAAKHMRCRSRIASSYLSSMKAERLRSTVHSMCFMHSMHRNVFLQLGSWALNVHHSYRHVWLRQDWTACDSMWLPHSNTQGSTLLQSPSLQPVIFSSIPSTTPLYCNFCSEWYCRLSIGYWVCRDVILEWICQVKLNLGENQLGHK